MPRIAQLNSCACDFYIHYIKYHHGHNLILDSWLKASRNDLYTNSYAPDTLFENYFYFSSFIAPVFHVHTYQFDKFLNWVLYLKGTLCDHHHN